MPASCQRRNTVTSEIYGLRCLGIQARDRAEIVVAIRRMFASVKKASETTLRVVDEQTHTDTDRHPTPSVVTGRI